jgi:hypothetical protein
MDRHLEHPGFHFFRIAACISYGITLTLSIVELSLAVASHTQCQDAHSPGFEDKCHPIRDEFGDFALIVVVINIPKATFITLTLDTSTLADKGIFHSLPWLFSLMLT